MKTSLCLASVLLLSSAAAAHEGGAHLQGIVKIARADGLTLEAEGKQIAVAFDKDTRFEKLTEGSGAAKETSVASKASELLPGARAVVHLKPGKGPATAALVKFAPAPAAQRVVVTVSKEGYLAANPPPLKAGQPVTLVVTRTAAKTCATELVIKEYGINQPLPLDSPVEITFTPTRPGKVRMACGMDMVSGELVVQ